MVLPMTKKSLQKAEARALEAAREKKEREENNARLRALEVQVRLLELQKESRKQQWNPS